ncbi:MAG: hypothetical protein GY737_00110 [Desulfobacteraceae bacterium]|nr:hypothetical protein [Desulfobacteraceae bacterium]
MPRVVWDPAEVPGPVTGYTSTVTLQCAHVTIDSTEREWELPEAFPCNAQVATIRVQARDALGNYSSMTEPSDPIPMPEPTLTSALIVGALWLAILGRLE